MSKELIIYLANYINEELSRDNEIDEQTIINAIDAFNGGAR